MEDYGACYVVVSEEILEKAAKVMLDEGENNSSFQRMIDVSTEYKAANLTPVVLYNVNTKSFFCIVKELYGKKLH